MRIVLASFPSPSWRLGIATAAALGGLAVTTRAVSSHLARQRRKVQAPEPAPAAEPSGEQAPALSNSAGPASVVQVTPPAGASAAAAARGSNGGSRERERSMGLRTLLMALQSSDRVSQDSIGGPFQMSAVDEDMVVCFQFRMSHFSCKAFLAHKTQDGGSQHVKLQTIFEDNRRSMGGEQGYFVANQWNATRRYTRLKCGSSGAARSSIFTLEYDVLCPANMPHSWGLLVLTQTLRMWYTSMVACVMHLVEPLEVPFATHEMIVGNTLSMKVRPEDHKLQGECCPICLETFKVGETVRRLPCLHTFHVVECDVDSEQCGECNIDKHLVHNKQCPVCKMPVDIMERAGRSSGVGGGSGSDASPVTGDGAGAASGAVSAEEAKWALLCSGAATADGTSSSNETAASPEVAVAAPTLPALDELPAGAATASAAAAAGAAAAGEPAAAAAAQDGPQGQGGGGDGATSANGLPAQAAELEHAVRSLQARWLQIQDVVQGMQHMLHYIEDHQQQQGGQDATAPAPSTSASGEANPQVAATEAAATEARTVATAPSDQGARSSPGVATDTATTSGAAGVAVSVNSGGELQPRGAGAAGPPFTEAEKVNMASAWRQRRAAMGC